MANLSGVNLLTGRLRCELSELKLSAYFLNSFSLLERYVQIATHYSLIGQLIASFG